MPTLTKTDKSDNSDIIRKLKSFFDRYGILILALVMLAVSVIHILPPFNADIINYDSSYQYFFNQTQFKRYHEAYAGGLQSSPLYLAS